MVTYCRWISSPPLVYCSRLMPIKTPICSGPCAAAAVTSASSLVPISAAPRLAGAGRHGPPSAGRGREVLRFYQDFTRGIADELTVYAAILTSRWHARRRCSPVITVRSPEGERLLEPLRKFGPPIADPDPADAVPECHLPAGCGQPSRAVTTMRRSMRCGASSVMIPWMRSSEAVNHDLLFTAGRSAPARGGEPGAARATAFALRESCYLPYSFAAWEDRLNASRHRLGPVRLGM